MKGMTPTNELGVIFLFAQQCKMNGFELVSIQAAFPDAVIVKDGRKYRTEFEFKATSFRQHGHDPCQCDLIVCWINNYPDSPLPILALSEANWARTPLSLPSPKIRDAANRLHQIKLEKSLWREGMKKTARIKNHRASSPPRLTPREIRERTAKLSGDNHDIVMKPNKTLLYQGYVACIADDQAQALFIEKYGYKPKEINRTGGSVNVGPISIIS